MPRKTKICSLCLDMERGTEGHPDYCSKCVCIPYVKDADARDGGSQEAGTGVPVDSELKLAIDSDDNAALVQIVEGCCRAIPRHESRDHWDDPDPLVSIFIIATKDVSFRDKLDSLYRGASDIVGQYAEILEDAESYYCQKVRTVYDNVYCVRLLSNSYVSHVKVTHFREFRDLLHRGPSLNRSDETAGTEAYATADTEATATAQTEATATAQTEATATADTEATATADDPTVDTTSETTTNSGSDFDVGRPCAPGVEQVVRDSKELESLEKNDAGCSVNVVNQSFRKRKRCEPLTTNSSPGQDAKEAQDAQFAPLSNHALETIGRGIEPLSDLDLEMFEQRLTATLKAKAVNDPQGDMVTPMLKEKLIEALKAEVHKLSEGGAALAFPISHTLRDTCVCSPQSHHPQQSRRFCQPENTFGASGYEGDMVTAWWNHLYHPQDTDMSGKCPPQSHDPELEKYAREEVQKGADNEVDNEVDNEWRKWLR